MTQKRTKTTIIVTVHLIDGSVTTHEYVFDYPTSDEDAATMRDLARNVRNALGDSAAEVLSFFYPLVWYRSSQVISVAFALRRDNEELPPAEVRRIGFV